MSMDAELLRKAIECSRTGSPSYAIKINGLDHILTDVSMDRLPTPVSRPTVRGGVYFSDRLVHRIRGTIRDTSVMESLTGKMLGPSTEFGELEISAVMHIDGTRTELKILTNLTNMVQTPGSVELNMVIVGLGR